MRVTSFAQFPVLLAAFGLSQAVTLRGGIVLDRIAVIVGNRVIKISDIDRDIRLTAFLNHAKAEFGRQTKKQSAERLID